MKLSFSKFPGQDITLGRKSGGVHVSYTSRFRGPPPPPPMFVYIKRYLII